MEIGALVRSSMVAANEADWVDKIGFENAGSNESLDYARQLSNRMSCFSVNSRWCEPEWEEKINVAKATPLGPEREATLAEMAQTAHDEYWFIPFFHVQELYGMATYLEWTPGTIRASESTLCGSANMQQ